MTERVDEEGELPGVGVRQEGLGGLPPLRDAPGAERLDRLRPPLGERIIGLTIVRLHGSREGGSGGISTAGSSTPEGLTGETGRGGGRRDQQGDDAGTDGAGPGSGRTKGHGDSSVGRTGVRAADPRRGRDPSDQESPLARNRNPADGAQAEPIASAGESPAPWKVAPDAARSTSSSLGVRAPPRASIRATIAESPESSA